jgi:DNA (cytosine-5)-methyltransferase 1
MAQLGWQSVDEWKEKANKIAPTLVGGSKKHGGADLGPTRARKAWAELGVDGCGLADKPPINGFKGNPRLTLQMTALIQGFPTKWKFSGKKTPAYRQVGNAFPAPVAKAIGKSIINALSYGEKSA